MSRAGICQVLCVVLLAVFIAFSLSQEKEITKSAAEIAEDVTSVINTENLQSFDELRLTEQFGFDTGELESWAYYGSEDIMNVREILVIKVKDGIDSRALAEIIDKRAEEKYNTFKDYDPTAAAILDGRVIENKNGVIFYAADESADEGLEAFLKSIDE